MSGSDKNKQTTVTGSQLAPGVLSNLNTAQSAAGSLFSSGNLFKPYSGSTVVMPSANTQAGNAQIVGNANAFQPALNQGFSAVSGIANGGNSLTTGGLFDQVGRDASNPSFSESNLAKYANGSMMGRADPAFDAVLKRAQEDATGAVTMGASAAGRYGSGIAQGNVAREVGDVTNQALTSRLNQDQANMFAANSAIDAQRQGNLATRLSAASGLTGVQQQNTQNIMTSAGMLPSLFDGTLDPARARLGVGATEEDLSGRQMNDDLRRWQEGQDQQRQAIEWLQGISSGAGTLGGSTTQTVSAPGTNPFLAGLGGSIAGATAFGGGVTGAGSLLGGGLGLLGSIF